MASQQFEHFAPSIDSNFMQMGRRTPPLLSTAQPSPGANIDMLDDSGVRPQGPIERDQKLGAPYSSIISSLRPPSLSFTLAR